MFPLRSSRRMPPTTKAIKRFIAARTPRIWCVSPPKRNFAPWIVWQRRDRRSNDHRIETERMKHMSISATPSPRGSARRTDSLTGEMKALAENSAGKQRGRPFPKGTSGNFAGKPKGARHRATIAAETLMSGEADAIVRAVIEKAKTGDMTAAKIILDRVAPIRRGAPLEVDLPAVATTEGVTAALAALVAEMSAGTVTPEEAQTVASVIEAQRKAIETTELESRVLALEERLK